MARKFALITDSGSDMPADYFAAHEIDCVKLGFTLDGATYGEDGGEMDVKEFYELLRNGAMPKTFQITPAQALSHIEPFAKEGKDILIIAFSSGLSGTYESYLTAAKEIKEKIAELLKKKDEINMIFAAAPSQNEVLDALADDGEIEWNRINGFHMDEYIGLSESAPQGFGNFLKARIFGKVNFKSVNYIDCAAVDPEKEAE